MYFYRFIYTVYIYIYNVEIYAALLACPNIERQYCEGREYRINSIYLIYLL